MNHSDDESMEDAKPAAKPSARPDNQGPAPSVPPAEGAKDVAATSSPPVLGEISFLITHWLAGFSNQPQTQQNPGAMTKIQAATSQLAEAFSEIGAFGQAKPSVGLSATSAQPTGSNLTYTDMKRTWGCPSDHLETVLEASKETTAKIESVGKQPKNYLQKCIEDQIAELKTPSSGRTLNEAIALDTSSPEDEITQSIASSLQTPALLTLKDGKLLDSALKQQQSAASSVMRRYLDARRDVQRLQSEVRMHERSLEYNRQLMLSLEGEDAASSERERVVAQLELKLPSLQSRLATTLLPKLIASQRDSLEENRKLRNFAVRFRHPVLSRPDFCNNAMLHNLQRRAVSGQTAVNTTRSSLLHHRFVHVVTINAHLNYPVYCLKFDATGRYFVTGADDYLVKVFQTVDNGAVLVCTLKGHAGVINDIGISSDNGFLATASDDGDVRVWGLRDGCPVAILRGHEGGANMVSWSVLVPYHLVTTGADGLARTWDIRMACLRRYSQWIGSRTHYTHTLHGKLLEEVTEQGNPTGLHGEGSVPVPVIPARDGGGETGADSSALNPPIQAHQQPNNAVINQIADAGSFIRNDLLDEGVRLLTKLQHGLPVDGDGAGTRTRRSLVKVICVSRCPIGGHFVTGSDDGKCRIWGEEHFNIIERLDQADLGQGVFVESEPMRSYGQTGVDPLLTLEGHETTVTDLAYSHAGSRIVSASQKDGAVRIWSWSTDPSGQRAPLPNSVASIKIELTKPYASARQQNQRNNRSPEALISCDVACWSNDDTRIMTSQCGYARENATEIIPGSQYIFLWDANTGNCLAGVASAHSMQCPVVLPHPVLPSVFCSAGADGQVKIWNWESGECLFSHTNIATVGPVDPNDRGKYVGFIDGHFSSDGTALVLSDDSGRVSYFDSSAHISSRGSPEWMKEQYFSNDYYDLFYDENGYCVERGSEMPPHLAPKGSRCTHSGVAFPSHLHDRFRKLTGPIPMGDRECRGIRQGVRRGAAAMLRANTPKRRNLTGRFNAKTTIVFNQTETAKASAVSPASTQERDTPAASSSRPSRQLSSNWRWRDFDDIERELGNDDAADPDSDDEEFDPSEVRRAAVHVADGSESEDNLEPGGVEEPDSPRQNYRESRDVERDMIDDEDSGGEFVEYMSTNNTPSGPYVEDYDVHLFKLPSRSHAQRLHRDWVRRNECASSYEGRKTYTPQVGDSVVYIPRVHFETLKEFPALEAPFLNWPEHTCWPVVKCIVRNIRYRFPFIQYRNACRSVVAKLTLELVGVPEMSEERAFPWPSPVFTVPTSESIFELSLFENDAPECIMPLPLYEKRITQLETAADHSTSGSIEVEAFFCETNGDLEDSVLVSYTGTVVEYKQESTDELFASPHLSGSGYRSVHLRWEGERRTDISSPWELGVTSPEEFNSHVERPQLDEDEKRIAREALREIRSIANVSDFFGQPVIEAYSDYGCRVEVPIDLSFISGRLEAGYYSNRLSIVADIRLVLTNCVKYNGENDSLTSAGMDMLSAFEARLLTPEVIDLFRQFDTPLAEAQPQIPHSYFSQRRARSAVEGSTVERRRLRPAESVSVLETIPAPDTEHIRRSSRVVRPPQNFGEDEHERRRSSRNRAHGRHRMQRRTQPSAVRTLEQISSSNQRSRGRSPGVGRRGRIRISLRPSRNHSAHVQPTRHSTRAGLRNSAPQNDEDSNTNEGFSIAHSENSSDIGAESPAAPPRRSLRLDPSTVEDEPGLTPSPSRGTSTATRQSRNSSTHRMGLSSGRPMASPLQTHESIQGSSPSVASPTGLASPNEQRTTRRTRAIVTDAAAFSDEDEKPSNSTEPRKRKGRSGRWREEEEEGSSFGEPESEPEDDSDEDVDVSSEAQSVENRKPRAIPKRKRPRRSESESDDPPRPKRQAKKSSNVRGGGDRPDRPKGARSASNRPKRARSSPPRKSKKLQTTSQPSYADPSSSEFDDEGSEDNIVRQPIRKVAKKRKGEFPESDILQSRVDLNLLAPDSSAQRKRYVHPTKRALYIKNWMNQFEISLWPEIAAGHISNVTKELVSRFQDLDEMGLFEVPVVEKHPEIGDAYLARVDSPMDFQTILNLRLNDYESIRDAQEDLVLVFANCMGFNEEGSVFHDAASTMMELLDSTFEGVCSDQRVRPLRHKS